MMPSFKRVVGWIFAFCPAAMAEPMYDFKPVDVVIEQAIADGKCPNADLVIGRGERVLYRKVYGAATVKPARTPMTPDLVFDLASLTKPMATATSILLLHERGRLDVAEPVAKYIPEFGQAGKETVTIQQCLLHIGGFIADNPMSDYADGGAQAIRRIYAAPLRHPPGEKFVYSDVGYIVLAEVVRAVDGRPIDQFAREEIFIPLGMTRTMYKPDPTKLTIVPTESIKGMFSPGIVHDPRALAMGGVAGHAGLFAPAEDVARFCRMLLGRGEVDGRRVLSDRTVAAMIAPRPAPDDRVLRTFGFDCVSGFDSPRGKHFAKGRSFGHTGYTGGSMWIDPDSGVWIVLLTSRLHPDGQGDVKKLRYDLATAAAEVLGVGG